MKRAINKIRNIVIDIFLLPVKFYRKFLSPLKPVPTCRFRPTCSQYCIEAVREWGIIVGAALTLWRILRCNPYSKGGYDPVPKRKRRR
ncbi:MAG: membrane protein insertion efficiency factor YidD [Clostridia bacterium]|jgi:putative membrane protein insertion efficiency factor|nr:membrane protein insertion efficiency factor YidD [Clostridia bacterium]